MLLLQILLWHILNSWNVWPASLNLDAFLHFNLSLVYLLISCNCYINYQLSSFQPLTISAKRLILDVLQGYWYASVCNNNFISSNLSCTIKLYVYVPKYLYIVIFCYSFWWVFLPFLFPFLSIFFAQLPMHYFWNIVMVSVTFLLWKFATCTLFMVCSFIPNSLQST